jgi:hypothetical protein
MTIISWKNDFLNHEFDFIEKFLNLNNHEYFHDNRYIKVFIITIALTISIFSVNLLNNKYIKLLFSMFGISSLFLLSLMILASTSTLLGFIGSILVVLFLHINLLPTLTDNIKSFFYGENSSNHSNHKKDSNKCKNSKKKCNKKKCNKKNDEKHINTEKLLKICDISSNTFKYDTEDLNEKLFNISI